MESSEGRYSEVITNDSKVHDQQTNVEITSINHEGVAVKRRKLCGILDIDVACEESDTISTIATNDSDDTKQNVHLPSLPCKDEMKVDDRIEDISQSQNLRHIGESKSTDAESETSLPACLAKDDKSHFERMKSGQLTRGSHKSMNNEHHHKKVQLKYEDRGLGISLIPTSNRKLLSEYNLMLTENIEFFAVPMSGNVNNGVENTSTTLPKLRIGLRCIHCSSSSRHITAATFFPSAISTISSGIGTIGARHFAGGKCPNLSSDIMEKFKETKKASQQQTRMPGRMGLDMYSRLLAKRENINDFALGGIVIDSIHLVSHPKANIESQEKSLREQRQPSSLVEKRRSLSFDRDDASAFIEGAVEHFWECKHCVSVPYHWRASGSVVFSSNAPTIDIVRKHLSYCQGKIPLCVPHNATVQINEKSDTKTTVTIQWPHQDKSVRKSGRIQKRMSNTGTSRKRRTYSTVPTLNMDRKTEGDNIVVHPEDKNFTTDFAYFTLFQLKKCFLTKAGGSRGNCPVGYPGLACCHCEGTSTARRFFYTSADHLRNSFSHIPSHLLSCSKCPKSTKDLIEDYKEIRNKQKSKLKVGDHKHFIDKVWERLHGKGGGVIESFPEEKNINEELSDDSSVSSISLDLQNECHRHRRPSYSSKHLLENDSITIEQTGSLLVSFNDRREITDYMFYAMLQMMPKKVEPNRQNCSTQESDNQVNSQVVVMKTVTDEVIDSNISKIDDIKTSSSPGDIIHDQVETINVFDDGSDCNNENQSVSDNKLCNMGVNVDVLNESDDVCNKQENADQTILGSNKSNNGSVMKCPNIGDNSNQQAENDVVTEGDEIGKVFTMVCRHCNDSFWQDGVPKSADDLKKVFPEIPKHLLLCQQCPNDVKEKLQSFKPLRAPQEAVLRRGAQKKFMNLVWERFERHCNGLETMDTQSPTLMCNTGAAALPSVINKQGEIALPSVLLTEDDRELVTQFTYFTMEQMKPCSLEKSGNGARSMFQYGFPGLCCIHCDGTPSARKFFYRTPDILSGNYAHIPNHVLACRHCPSDIKKRLADMKKIHADEKMRLHRGSQRVFFSNVWRRLHSTM